MATNFKSNKPKSAKPEPVPVAKPAVVAAKPAVVAAKPVVVAAKPAAKASASYQPTQEEIGVRAFEIYVSEGCQEGSDLDNWLRAEKELRSQNRK
jgi:hypothetical protein